MVQSLTLDELVVIINAQTKDFKRQVAEINDQLDGVSQQAEKSTSKMGSAFSKVGKVATGALTVGVVSAIGAVAASIPAAIKRIDTLVAFPRMLEAMGATSKEAKAATDKLSESLRGLPTPLQDGARGVQALVASGLKVPKATDAYLAFNNAMLAANVDAGTAEQTFMQLTQAISRGKIEGQEWNSITANMPTALQALSNETGKTKVQLQELYRTNPQKLLDDLIRLNKEGGGGLASLEAQARTATGGIGTAFENMKNSITRGLQGIVTQLGNGNLEAGQRKISDSITATGKAFGDALGKIAELVTFLVQNGHIFEPVAVGIGKAREGILLLRDAAELLITGDFKKQMFGGAFAEDSPLVDGILSVREGIERAFMSISGAVQSAWAVMKPVAIWFKETLWPILLEVGEYVGGTFKHAWETMNQAWADFGPALKVIGTIIGGIVVVALLALVGAIVAVVVVGVTLLDWLARAGEFFRNLWSTIANGISTAVKWLLEAWESVKTFFAGLPAWFDQKVNMIVQAISNGIKAIMDWFSRLPENIAYTLGYIAGSLFKFATQTVPDFVNRVIDWVGKLPGRVASFMNDMASRMATAARNGFNATVNWFQQLPGRIAAFVSDMYNRVTSWFRNTANSATKTAGDAVNGVINWFRQLPGRVVAAFGNARSLLVEVGKDMIRGLLGGIESMAGAVADKAKSVANSAVSGFKDALGIQSPSTVLRDEVGKMMGAGMAEGIEASTRAAMKSAANSAKNVFGAYNLKKNLPSPQQLSSRLDLSLDSRLSDLEGSSHHVTVKIGEDTLVDRIIKGINDKSFMSGGTVITV